MASAWTLRRNQAGPVARDTRAPSSASDDASLLFIGLAVIIGLGWLAHHFSSQINGAWAFWRLGEAYMVRSMPWIPAWRQSQVDHIITYLTTTPAGALQPQLMDRVDADLLPIVRWLYAAVFLAVGGLLFTVRNGLRGDSAKVMMERHAELYPWVRHALNVDYANQSLVSGPYRAREHGLEWAKRSRCLLVPKNNRSGRSRLDSKAASAAFALQLGDPFSGVDTLTRPERLTLAILGTFLMNGKEASAPLIHDAYGWVDKIISDREIDKTVNRALGPVMASPDIRKILDRHAYFRTAVISLTTAITEQRGVIQATTLQWCKEVDRVLWYTFIDTGHAPSVECSGVQSHWLIESRRGRPISLPQTDGAVTALEYSLSRQGVIDTPDWLMKRYDAQQKTREELLKNAQAAQQQGAGGA